MKRGHLCRSHVGHQCDEISQLSEPRNEVGPVLRHSTSAVIEAKPTTKLRLCVPLSAICFGAASIFVQSPNRHSAKATPNHGGGVTGREEKSFQRGGRWFRRTATRCKTDTAPNQMETCCQTFQKCWPKHSMDAGPPPQQQQQQPAIRQQSITIKTQLLSAVFRWRWVGPGDEGRRYFQMAG